MIIDEKTVNSIKKNLDIIQEQIDRAAEKSCRKSSDIRLMAVSKTQPIELIEAVYQTGHRLFGENRVIEGKEKFSCFHEDAEIHLIGHLQRNKAKHVVPTYSSVQSIDKIKTITALENYIPKESEKLDLYIEVNTSHEESKNGCSDFDGICRIIEYCIGKEQFRLRGLMTIGPLTGDEKRIRTAFADLRDMSEKANERFPELKMGELSMGMSGDFESAIAEGATLVRVGTAIFGQRRNG